MENAHSRFFRLAMFSKRQDDVEVVAINIDSVRKRKCVNAERLDDAQRFEGGGRKTPSLIAVYKVEPNAKRLA